MSSMRSATSAAHRVPNHAGPNPRAAGLSALSLPPRIAGSYPSFQPAGGLAPGVLRHHGAAVPSALPHDRRVWSASPGQSHPAVMAVNPHSQWLKEWLGPPVAGSLAESYTSAIPAPLLLRPDRAGAPPQVCRLMTAACCASALGCRIM